MKYDIFYFSGTGNSLKIAREVAERLESDRPKKIKATRKSAAPEYSENIGVVFPTYVFGIPNIVREFLESLSGVKRAFAIVSHGGMPGASLSQADDIFSRKDIDVIGLFSIKMPDNYIIMFDREKEEKITHLIEKQEKAVEEIVDSIESGSKENVKLAGRIPLKAINRMFVKRLKKTGDGFYCDEKCTECGVCQKICPVENIYIEDGKPRWKDRCEGCMACIQWCPAESIQYRKRTLKKKRYTNPDVDLKAMMD